MTDLAVKALAVNEAYHALGNERYEAEGATFVRNGEIPGIWDANHVTGVTASTAAELERLFDLMEREYAGCGHRRVDVDFRTPPGVEARLLLEGYRKTELLVMLLQGELKTDAKPHEIRAVESGKSWEAYTALHNADWREYRERMPGGPGGFDEETARQMIRSRRSKSPPVRHWLAYLDGEPRAYCSSWGGVDGVGQVEDLFAHAESRRRGLATALIHHCVAEARKDGAGPVVIGADPTDTPKRMYAAMGFRPVAVKRDYLKRV